MSAPYGRSGFPIQQPPPQQDARHHQPPPQAFTFYQPIQMADTSQMGGLHQQTMMNHPQVVQPIMIPVPVPVGPGVTPQMVGQPFATTPHGHGFEITPDERLERRRSEEIDYYRDNSYKGHSKMETYEHERNKHTRRTDESSTSSRYRSHSEERRLHSSDRSYDRDYDTHSRSRSPYRHSDSGKAIQFRTDISPERRSDRYVQEKQGKHDSYTWESKRDSNSYESKGREFDDFHVVREVRDNREISQGFSRSKEADVSYSRERDSYRKVSMEGEHDLRGPRDNRRSAYSSESSYKSRKRTGSSIPEMNEWEHKNRKISLSCSPISHDSSHGKFSGEMKIHVGQGGRWIETNRDMSPISDHENFDDVEIQTSGSARLMEDGIEIHSRVNRHEDERRVSMERRLDTRENIRGHAVLIEDAVLIDDGRPKHTVLMEEGLPVGIGRSRKEFDRRKEEMDHSRGVDDHLENLKTNVSGRSESARRSGNEKAYLSNDVGQLDCKIPNLCQYHNNKGGCTKTHCNYLHICKHFIQNRCKFGGACIKSHNLFAGQPFLLLLELNNHFKKSKMPSFRELLATLRDRYNKPGYELNKPAENIQSNTFTEVKGTIEENKEYDEFDARRYAGDKYKKDPVVKSGGDHDAKKYSSERKDAGSDCNVKKYTHERNAKPTSRKLSDGNRRRSVGKSHEQKGRLEQLSPVSVENEDWETIDKYETVSEEDFPARDVHGDLKDDLDDVSSEGSCNEANINTQSNVNLQYASNVAVPIGMDEPLVFNPNKGKAPGQTVPIYLVPVMPGQLPGQMMVNMNIAPPPTILEQVIQSLPPYEYKAPMEVKEEPPEVQVIKEDDKTTTEAEYHREHNEDEPESEMKEFIKELWKFPHKGILSMSVIDFVTETDAYQDELIAEILKILITLDLSYVTMKKLIALVKDKLSIAIKSAADMRKILELYPNNFKIIETVDSDDEGDEGEVRKKVQIQAKVELGFCDKHGFLPFYVGKCDCNSLHICKFHFLSSCSLTSCKFGHTFKTGHNISVLKFHRLHRMTGEEIQTYLQDFDNRGSETIPGVCKFYNRDITGCYKGNSTDNESICHNLHVCYHYAKGICLNKNCKRSHSIREEQPFSLLQKYGLDPNEFGDDNILQLLSKKLLASEEEKIQKSEASKKDGNSNKIVKTGSNTAGVVKTGKDGKGVDKTKLSHKVSDEHDSKVPSVCKFYNNAGGCKKKDWGPEGICYFLHICQHFVLGDCKFGSACKRSHDLFSGHAAILLNRYGIDTTTLTAGEILNRLNKTTGTPVEIPKLPEIEDDSSDEGVEDADGEVGKNKDLESNENVMSDKTAEVVKNIKVEAEESIEETGDYVKKDSDVDETVKVSEINADGAIVKAEVDSEGVVAQESGALSGVVKSVKKEEMSFRSCNIEEVIQHIINEKRVDKVKRTSDK